MKKTQKTIMFIVLPLALIAVGVLLNGIGASGKNRMLINRGSVISPSSSGNFTIVLWNHSPRTPYAKILVEIVVATEKRRLYYGTMPFPDQHPEETGGTWDGHNRDAFSFDMRPGSYDVLVHELNTNTVGVQKVVIPPSGKWNLEIDFSNSNDDGVSPYPYFSFEQGTEIRKIM